MNIKAISLVLLLGFAAVTVGFGGQKSTQKKVPVTTVVPKTKTARKAAAQGSEKVALTGSFLKESIRRNGLITDGRSQVLVIDSPTIRNSGATDVRALLMWKGIH